MVGDSVIILGMFPGVRKFHPPPTEILPNMVRGNLGPRLKNCRLLVITKRSITLEKVSYSLIYSRIDECELCIAHWYGRPYVISHCCVFYQF